MDVKDLFSAEPDSVNGLVELETDAVVLAADVRGM